MKVTAKILALFFTSVVLLTALTSYLTVWRTFQRYEEQQQTVATWLSHWIREEVEQSYREQGPAGIEQLVARLEADSPDLRLRWIRVAPNSIERGEMLIDGRPATLDSYMARHDTSRQWVLHTHYPILVDDECIGAIELETSLNQWQRENFGYVIVALGSLGGLALIAVATVYIAGVRWIADPLSQLIEQARRIGEGDFETRVSLDRRDEMGQLAETLNQTSALLSRQRQQLEDETRKKIEAVQQLRHADRLKTVGRLAAGVAHELGTPLSVISGRALSLQREGLSDEQLNQHALAIKNEADRMSNIIRQLLDYSRRREPQRHRIDLSEIVDQCRQLLGPIATKSGVEIRSDVPGQPAWAQVDPGQIQQVITNLLINAIHASRDGSPVAVQLRCSEPSEEDILGQPSWRIEVADQGAGISPQDQPAIFEPFFSTKGTGEGTGLGLPIAKGLVEDHDGRLTVESQVGAGSRFIAWIPRELPS